MYEQSINFSNSLILKVPRVHFGEPVQFNKNRVLLVGTRFAKPSFVELNGFAKMYPFSTGGSQLLISSIEGQHEAIAFSRPTLHTVY